MGTKPVRVPEDQYRELKRFAASLNVTLSEAISLALEQADLDRITEEQVPNNLDPDLNKELTGALLEASSDTEIFDIETELVYRQIDRNRERSDLIDTET